MHDLDRTQLESDFEDSFETDEFEYEPGEYEFEMEEPMNEGEEMELATELLEVTDEAELDQFLGKLIKKASKGVRTFIKSPAGRSIGGILKGVAKQALPIAGKALGTYFGGPVGGMVGGQLGGALGGAVGGQPGGGIDSNQLLTMGRSMFGLELEGLSNEDQEFEVAKRFVRLADTAVKKAITSPSNISPKMVAKNAVIEAAKIHAPGIVSGNISSGSSTRRGRYGKWLRRGNKIILYGV